MQQSPRIPQQQNLYSQVQDQSSEAQRLKGRSKQFMNSFGSDDLKSRCAKHQVSLCKSKRQEASNNRRNITVNVREWININKHYKPHYNLEDLPELVQAMHSEDEDRHLFAAQGIRKLVSLTQQDPTPLILQQVINAGVIPYLLQWLQRDDFPQLQLESAWVITNIGSDSHAHVQVIVQNGVVPYLVHLLDSPIEKVREQCVWALGNIAGDAACFRDVVIQHRGLSLLIKCLQNTQRLSMINIVSWAINNVSRGKPALDYDSVKEALPVIAKLVIEQQDFELLGDACQTLSHFIDNGKEKVDALIETGVVPRLIELLGHHVYHIQLQAIRIIRKILAGDERQNQVVVNLQGLPHIAKLLTSPKKKIREEAVLCIQNVCAITNQQMMFLLALADGTGADDGAGADISISVGGAIKYCNKI